MSKSPALPQDSLSKAIDAAIAGNTQPLYALLARGSGLPGTRANLSLLDAFAEECRARGGAVDALLRTMATLDADAAPGATALEFLPMCGVAGLGARAIEDDAAFGRLLAQLHDAADDLRFRVRDVVPLMLGRIGARRGAELLEALEGWMDGFFHAAAVLTALQAPGFLAALDTPELALARLDQGFVLARDAARAAARYPGHKALVEALGKTPAALAARFGVPVFDLLERWTKVETPALREAIAENLRGPRLVGRFSAEIARVRTALEATTKAPRDPRSYVGPTRGRGRRSRR